MMEEDLGAMVITHSRKLLLQVNRELHDTPRRASGRVHDIYFVSLRSDPCDGYCPSNELGHVKADTFLKIAIAILSM